MNSIEESESVICTQCNQKVIGYPNKFCRRQFLSSSQHQTNIINNINESISGNYELDKFIKRTQSRSKHCDDFIEWIPSSNLKSIKFLTNGGNSKIYSGIWLLNMSSISTEVILKEINDSENINPNTLNEFKMHHKCRSRFVIPFYGIAKVPRDEHAMVSKGEYAMVIRHAKYGDLRNYIRKFFSNLNWTNKANILIELSRALNSLHKMNLVHRDLHCKNILVDEEYRIFINDLELCQSIDSEIVSNYIQGVLPYIAPEVLRYKPYTKQSEVYSMSMIMWELTSKKPPFSNYYHDVELAFAILDGLRPKIVEGTPDFYADFMQQCWDSDPSQRPNASLLPNLFEEMLELCKVYDMSNDNINSPKLGFQPDIIKNSNENSTKSDHSYVTEAYKYSLKLQDNNETEEKKVTKEFSIELTNQLKSYTSQSITDSFDISSSNCSAIEDRIIKKVDEEKLRKTKHKKYYDEDDKRAQKLRKYQKSGKLNKKKNRRSQILEQDDDDSLVSESEGDSRYTTQTYDFSLDDLNKSYNNRNYINN